MTRKKIDVKVESDKDRLDPSKDEFVVTSMSFLDWLVERRRQVGVILALALLVAVGAIVFNNHRDSVAAESSMRLSAGLDAWTAPIVRTTDENGVPMERNNDLLSFESREKRATETLSRTEKAISSGDVDVYARLAGLIKASALFDKGDYDKAAAAYQSFLSGDAAGVSWLYANAFEGLISSLHAAGKKEEAAKIVERFVKENPEAASVCGPLSIKPVRMRKPATPKAPKNYWAS